MHTYLCTSDYTLGTTKPEVKLTKLLLHTKMPAWAVSLMQSADIGSHTHTLGHQKRR